jgi:hypothetical protein
MALRYAIAAKKVPSAIDKHVGSRVRMRRIMLASGKPLRGLTELIGSRARLPARPLRGSWIAQGCAASARGTRIDDKGDRRGERTSVIGRD